MIVVLKYIGLLTEKFYDIIN